MRIPMDVQQTRREFFQWSAALIVQPVFAWQVPAGRVATIVGTGGRGSAAEGETVDRTQINNPFHTVIGPDGSLYWSDFGTHRVLRADLRSKKISVVAGTGTRGYSGAQIDPADDVILTVRDVHDSVIRKGEPFWPSQSTGSGPAKSSGHRGATVTCVATVTISRDALHPVLSRIKREYAVALS